MTEHHPGTPPSAFVRLATFENELEARRVESELQSRNIPHLLKSYRDAAYAGVFQNHRGWGHLEAPAMFREEIGQIRRDLVESADPLPHGARQSGFVRWTGWLFLGWFAAVIVSAAADGLLFQAVWVSTVLIGVLAAWFIRRRAKRIVDMLRARSRDGS